MKKEDAMREPRRERGAVPRRSPVAACVERLAQAVRRIVGRQHGSLEELPPPPDDPVPTPRAGRSIPSAPPEVTADLGTRLLDQIPSGLSPKIAERFITLCQDSEARGEPAVHCREPHCVPSALCSCGCAGCRRATVFLRQARQEAISRGGGVVA